MFGATTVARASAGVVAMTDRRLPIVEALVFGRTVSCLVDTGSERTMIDARVVEGTVKKQPCGGFTTADGRTVSCAGGSRIPLGLDGHCFWVHAYVVNGLARLGVQCLLGSDVIDHMGGVQVKRVRSRFVVNWGRPEASGCCRRDSVGPSEVGSAATAAGTPLEINDKDFVATFSDGRWTVKWKWSGREPERLRASITEYKCTQLTGVRDKYDAEVQSWISKGWLRKWNGPHKGIIPLLAVVQPTKDKVRPVMDYRELNQYVECHTGDEETAICGEKIRRWRQFEGVLKIVDLRSAYLQIHVSRELWQYQVVEYKGVRYALTRLGFGLSPAPRIMTMILKKVLSMDDDVRRGTDSYIDDIVVRESVVSADKVRRHLARYGLESKKPESLDGGRVLGITLNRSARGDLMMSRTSEVIKTVEPQITKRQLFSICGRLIGHYPVANWLRPCCSFLKRLGCGGKWDRPVDDRVRELLSELLRRVSLDDPVKGRWHVRRSGRVTAWTDASSVAIGVALEVDGAIVEDASWLRKKGDSMHINVAELEAVGRGVNLAIAWGFSSFEIATDSRTVAQWMDNTVEGYSRVRTKGTAEMLIKRRLMVLKETIAEHGLDVRVRLVSTTENKADVLSRVPKKWLAYHGAPSEGPSVSAVITTGESREDAIWSAHLPHHLGVERTLYLARQIRGDLTRSEVDREVAKCDRCRSIDPALREENSVEQGSLAVEQNWRRIAVDVTHYSNDRYLTMVDCGPSRIAIWRRMSDETAMSVVTQLRLVVLERGPFDELLLDNATAFRSEALKRFADEWGISLRFRAAYVPSGNGIVERNHRTIKRIAARGNISPEEAVYWYNATPRKGGSEESVPSWQIFRYSWRIPFDSTRRVINDDRGRSAFAVGDLVWLKPAVPSCTARWSRGRVTKVVSEHVVCVDGMPRHVRDIRSCIDDVAPNHSYGVGGGGAIGASNFGEEAHRLAGVADEGQQERLGLVEAGGEPQIRVAPEEATNEVEGQQERLGPVEAGGEPQVRVAPEEAEAFGERDVAVEVVEEPPRRPRRERRPPVWLRDYAT